MPSGAISIVTVSLFGERRGIVNAYARRCVLAIDVGRHEFQAVRLSSDRPPLSCLNVQVKLRLPAVVPPPAHGSGLTGASNPASGGAPSRRTMRKNGSPSLDVMDPNPLGGNVVRCRPPRIPEVRPGRGRTCPVRIIPDLRQIGGIGWSTAPVTAAAFLEPHLRFGTLEPQISVLDPVTAGPGVGAWRDQRRLRETQSSTPMPARPVSSSGGRPRCSTHSRFDPLYPALLHTAGWTSCFRPEATLSPRPGCPARPVPSTCTSPWRGAAICVLLPRAPCRNVWSGTPSVSVR